MKLHGSKGLFLLLALLLTVGMLVSACGKGGEKGSQVKDTKAEQSKEPIRIGWLSSLTGPLSSAAIAENKGVQFAVDEINKSGGINGRQIDLLTRDTQGDPTKATSYAQQLISSNKVDFIIGPVNSGESLATVPIIAKSGVPNIIIGTVDILTDVKKYPRAFRVIATNTQWIEAANNYAIKVLGATKIALIGDNTGYGTSTVEQAEGMLTKQNAKVVYKAVIDPNQTDVSMDMRKAQQAGAEAVMIWSAATGLDARLIESRSQIGWNVPILGHPAIASSNVGQLLSKPSNWDSVYAVGYKSASFDAKGDLPKTTQEFLEKIKPVIGSNIDYTLWWVSMGYDTVQVIKNAVTKAGSTDPAKVQEVFESTSKFAGAYGTYTWSKEERNGFPTDEVVMNIANTFKNGTYQLAPDKK